MRRRDPISFEYACFAGQGKSEEAELRAGNADGRRSVRAAPQLSTKSVRMAAPPPWQPAARSGDQPPAGPELDFRRVFPVAQLHVERVLGDRTSLPRPRTSARRRPAGAAAANGPTQARAAPRGGLFSTASISPASRRETRSARAAARCSCAPSASSGRRRDTASLRGAAPSGQRPFELRLRHPGGRKVACPLRRIARAPRAGRRACPASWSGIEQRPQLDRMFHAWASSPLLASAWSRNTAPRGSSSSRASPTAASLSSGRSLTTER